MQGIIQKYIAGHSAREVAEQEGCGLAKVYYTLRKNNIPRRTASATNTLRFQKSPLSFCAPKKIAPSMERLKYLALGLYWGEGSKTNNVVDIANSDPEVLKIFLHYLIKCLKVDTKKLRVNLYCFDDQDINNLKKFWSTQLGIPISQFIKPYIRKNGNKRTRKMRTGVAHIRYCDKRLLEYLLNEISQSQTLLVGGGGFEPPKA